MVNLKKLLPANSIFHHWLASRYLIETPVAFDLACGISALGALLKREVWVDQIKWKIYPNMSVMLVGPSGIGKDTAIDGAEEILQEINSIKVIGGRTSESIFEQMYNLGNPACAVILAHEMSAFFGKKDYQASLVQDLTDLMSTKPYKDISNKGDLYKNPQGKRILKPTLTLMAGSTPEWLHTAMPVGSLEGGFFGRFLILTETKPKRLVPLIKYSSTNEEQRISLNAKTQFISGLREVVSKNLSRGEIILLREAQDAYGNWYANRTRYFSPLTQPYAHRCRDHVLRLALLCAVSCGNGYINSEDIEFATGVITHLASTLDTTIAPPNMEHKVGREIKEILPASMATILRSFGSTYSLKSLKEAVVFLLESKQIKKGEDGVYMIV